MQCPNCNTERDTKDFKRLASLAQTRAWLKKPTATKRMAYTGTVCNACHKQLSRKPSDLSLAEFRARLVNEGLPPNLVNSLYESRAKAGKAKLRAGGLRSMKAQRKHLFTQPSNELNHLINSLKRRIEYVRETDHNANALFFLETCLAQALLARDKLWNKRKMGGTPPARWTDFIGDAEHSVRRTAYTAMPSKYKDRFRSINVALSAPESGG